MRTVFYICGDKKEIKIVKEAVLGSLFADLWTIALFVGAAWVCKECFNNSVIASFGLVSFLFFFIGKTNLTHEISKEEAINEINKD